VDRLHVFLQAQDGRRADLVTGVQTCALPIFFTGMILPQYREGDTTFSGRNIADVVESGKMEVRAKVTEPDRDNLKEGQKATVQKIGRAPRRERVGGDGRGTGTAPGTRGDIER